ncbi:MAG: TIGR03619 family F420-dependent LLM class oxidoreductase [Candidatus Dormibacteraeota bacterium]|nr:TIGR03619 family F420-dependent LLM class oxidoreductase [Candidatus Dormibacteraeota bacterium]
MELGVFLPISGRAASAEVLTEAARQAERLGFEAVWSADRVVTPARIDTTYPYSENQQFIVPPDLPFLDSLTCLAFLAGRTERVKLGISVLVLPYRHPLHWARVAVSLDRLSQGRFILGVGVGWMEEEFAALGAPFKARGRVSDEQLEIVARLWSEERISFHGSHHGFDTVAFAPKPQSGHLATWVGGEARAARRRAGRYGDAWFPYYVDITPAELCAQFEEALAFAAEAGRGRERLKLCVCRPIEVTRESQVQDPRRLRGTPEQLTEALVAYRERNVHHLALQFMVGRWPERLEQIERFGSEVIPALR